MNKNIEYVHKYVDGLSEIEIREVLKRILSDEFTNEKTNQFKKSLNAVSAIYLSENASKPVNLNIKLKQ